MLHVSFDHNLSVNVCQTAATFPFIHREESEASHQTCLAWINKFQRFFSIFKDSNITVRSWKKNCDTYIFAGETQSTVSLLIFFPSLLFHVPLTRTKLNSVFFSLQSHSTWWTFPILAVWSGSYRYERRFWNFFFPWDSPFWSCFIYRAVFRGCHWDKGGAFAFNFPSHAPACVLCNCKVTPVLLPENVTTFFAPMRTVVTSYYQLTITWCHY